MDRLFFRMNKKLSHIGEFGLIDLLKQKMSSSRDVIKGIGDDAAVMRLDVRKFLLLTTDMLVEGVHFTKRMDPFGIGHKAMACNISDIAAMGGWPTFAVVSLGVPGRLGVDFVKKIYQGLNALARSFRVAIVGGDTVRSRTIVINVALLGEVNRRQLVLRSGAKVGDQIFVTGPLGRSFQSGRHLTFTPRIAESQFLVKHFLPTAMIDLSDGLSSDLGHILDQSRVAARIYADKVPLNPRATLQQALTDGEDFELLFTLPKKEASRLAKTKSKGCEWIWIGEIVEKKNGLILRSRHGQETPVRRKGFRHF